MSRRVDLYPLPLAKLTVLLGPRGLEHGHDLLVSLKQSHPSLSPALLDELMSGRLRASQPEHESGAVAAIVAHLAYARRDPALAVLFDWGGVWNDMAAQLEAGAFRGEERRLVRHLLRGRPLVAATMGDDGNGYAWIGKWEMETFAAVLRRCRGTGSEEAHTPATRAWLDTVAARGLDVFVSIG